MRQLRTSLFTFLSIHIPIYYLFTIIPTDYSNIDNFNSSLRRAVLTHAPAPSCSTMEDVFNVAPA